MDVHLLIINENVITDTVTNQQIPKTMYHLNHPIPSIRFKVFHTTLQHDDYARLLTKDLRKAQDQNSLQIPLSILAIH